MESHPISKGVLSGYPTVARYMTTDRDGAMYRKFSNLSTRNLLFLQAELAEMEAKLNEYDEEDAQNIADPLVRRSARNHAAFKLRSGDPNGAGHERMQLMKQINSAIKEYQEALLLERQIIELEEPSERALTAFRRFFGSGTAHPKLGGNDEFFLRNEADLVALASLDPDRLNRFLLDYLGWFFRKEKEMDHPDDNIFYFPERPIRRIGAILVIIMSAILIIGAIACLTLVANHSWKLRLGMIVLFTVLFAGVVGLITNATRAEIFGSTAAYAAVLVVFVSGNLGNR